MSDGATDDEVVLRPKVDKVGLSSDQHGSLYDAQPAMSLPPYNQKSLETLLSNAEIKTPVSAAAQIANQYKGKRVEFIPIEITTPQRLPGNTRFKNNINAVEDGRLINFEVAVNNFNVRIKCILYDKRSRPDTIINHTPLQLVDLGRGLTRAEAFTTEHNGISVDKGGRPSSVVAYVSRFKHTFDLGFNDPTDYGTVEGTTADKWFVVRFEPSTTRPYDRIQFDLENTSASLALIHEMKVMRAAFVDDYELVVKDPSEILPQMPVNKATIKY